jgi:hypothetical protein
VSQETEKAQGKPALNAESFQCLLFAAYLLQADNHYHRSVQPIGPDRTSRAAAGAIVQKRTPSVRLVLPAEPTVPHMAPVLAPVLSRGQMFWRTVETLTIATIFCIMIFCMMMGLSIHRLSALSGRAALSSEMPEQRSASQAAEPTAKVLTSPQGPVITRNSSLSSVGGDGNSVTEYEDEDLVIRYQKSNADLPGQAAKRATSGLAQGQLLPAKNTTAKPDVGLRFGRDADMLAADTVVQYGADVTMWSGNTKRAGLDRVGR